MTLLQGLRYIHGLQDEEFTGKGMTVSRKSVQAAKDFWIKFHTEDMIITTGYNDIIRFENCLGNDNVYFSFSIGRYETDYEYHTANIRGVINADF